MLQYHKSAPDTPKGTPQARGGSGTVGSLEVLRVLDQLAPDEQLVRFFERNDVYEVYGSSAGKVATILHRTTHLQYFGPSNTAVLSVQPVQLSTALKELLCDHRIEIWAFNGVRRSWRVVTKASPGNFEQIEALLADETDAPCAPVIASVVARRGDGDERVFGLAYADLTRFVLGWTQFVDCELLSNVEAALVQLDARECIFPHGLSEMTTLLETSTVVGTPLGTSEFDSDSTREDLQRLLNESCRAQAETVADVAMLAITGLIKYLNLLSLDSNLGVFTLTPLDLAQYMRLDETALKALNIFPGPTGGKSTSLYGILEHCKTRQGARLLSQWLRQPLLNTDKINERLDVVQLLVENSIQRQGLRETVLRGIPDVARVSRKLVKGKASLQDLVNLYFAAAKIQPIHEQLAAIHSDGMVDARLARSLEELLMRPLCHLSTNLTKYAELIEKTVDFAALHRHEYVVRADFDPSLAEINRQKEAILDRIENEFERAVHLLRLEKGKKIKLERNAAYGYYLRVSRLDGALLTRHEGVFQELAALKNGIHFTTGELRELSLRYDELGREYVGAQQTLVLQMIRVAATYRRLFDELNQTIALVDVLQSLAYAAVTMPLPLVRPEMMPMGSGELILLDARHPCVEASCANYIPNNVHFSPDATFQIITGPNMGGKSTFIRQTAMIALMAQIGSFVPCSAAQMPVFDAVLVRVGAGDSILRGLSTFMMEMLETASILRTATPRSLVIIDELGRGTSTSEGLGLAWGVSRQLAQRRCPTFFATHFHELTSLATTLPNVRNLHTVAMMEAGTLIMTYRMVPGVADQSWGVQVAKMAKFPPVVVDMAGLLLEHLEGWHWSEEQMREAQDIFSARGPIEYQRLSPFLQARLSSLASCNSR